MTLKIILCIVLIIFGYFFHIISKNWINKWFKRQEFEKLLNSKKAYTLMTFLLSTVKYVVYAVVIYLICKILELPIDSFFIAIAGAGGVALGLGAQSLVKNIINGFFILIEDQYSVGDMVMVGDLMGVVEEIGIRTTKIRSVENHLHIIPNGEISLITNMTNAKALVLVNLPYEANAEKVMEILKVEMLKVCIEGLNGQPVVDGITVFGQHVFTVRILAECEIGKNFFIERELRLQIMNRLEKEGIPMPVKFPLFLNGEAGGL